MSDNVILYGNLEIEGFNGLEINVLRIEHALNEHTVLTVTGLLKDEDKENCLQNITVNGEIKVKRDGMPVFHGIITEAAVTKKHDVYNIEITGYSYTRIMDVEKESKSFQDKDMLYKNLVQEIVGAYQAGSFLDEITDNKPLSKPIIQYKETDWEFLKRVASHFNASLVPNVYTNGPQFFFGLPRHVDKGVLEAYNYRVIKDLWKYKRLSIESDIHEGDCIFYDVETFDIYDLGDLVTFLGKQMSVIQSVYEYRDAVIINRCLLAFEKGAQTIYVPNNNISGCSIFGKVIDVARDNLKIHLEIDETQSVDTAYWYPYATMYASQDETGWYCMPEIGDTVRLYHPEQEEARAMAINSLKPHDPNEDVEQLDPGHRMGDPDVKYLRTAFGKEIKFRPSGIDIIAKDGTVYMVMDDDGSVTLISNDKISLTAMNDIIMKARNINIEATDHILLKAKGSSIDMKQDIVLKGKEVKTN